MSNMMPESQASRALKNVNSKNYNKDLVKNIAHLNAATDYMASYMRGMQKGIDEANKDIFQKIGDLVENLIIIFTGGTLGDLGDDLLNIGGLAEAFILNIPILGDLYALLKKLITGEGDFVLPSFLQGSGNFMKTIWTMLNQIGDIFKNKVVTPVNEAIGFVKDWFLSFLGFKKYTDESFDDTNAEFANQGQIIQGIDYQKANIVDVPNDIPMWQTMNPTEDPSIPRINLASAVSGHDPFFSITAGKMEMAFIRSPRKRIYNTVGFIVDNTMSSTAPIFVAVYRMTNFGELVIEWASTNIQGLITNQRQEIRLDIPTPLIAEGGEYFAVGILQTGATRKLCGVSMPDIAVPENSFPLKMKATSLGGQSSPPNGIPRHEIDFTGTWIPWVCLGEKVLQGPPSPLRYMDDFERGNSGNLGPGWAQRGDIGVKSGRATTIQQTDGIRTALHTYPLNYDDHWVDAKFGTASLANYTVLILRGNSQFTRGFGVSVSRNDLSFVRCTGVNQYSFVGSKFSNGIRDGDVIRVEVEGDVFSVYRNNTFLRSITDTGSPKGIGYRFFGMSMARSVFTSSPEIDRIEARDFLPPHPGGRLGARIRRDTVLESPSGSSVFGISGMVPTENLTVVEPAAAISIENPPTIESTVVTSLLSIPRDGWITAASFELTMKSLANNWSMSLIHYGATTNQLTEILRSPVQAGRIFAEDNDLHFMVKKYDMIIPVIRYEGPLPFPGEANISEQDLTISSNTSPAGGFKINLNELESTW